MTYTTAFDQLTAQIVSARRTCETDIGRAEHEVAMAGKVFGEAIERMEGNREEAAAVLTALLSLGTALGALDQARQLFQGLQELTPGHEEVLRDGSRSLADRLFDVTIKTTFRVQDSSTG
jgi:hypothetical protein